jgi:adenylate kinase family enzyme
MVKYIQPLPFPSLIIFGIVLVALLSYCVLFFIKRKKILELTRGKDGVVIFGFPNSGKTTLAKWLCGNNLYASRFIDGICYASLTGNEKIKIYDANLLREDGKISSNVLKNILLLKPKIGIATVDFSRFSIPIEEQVEAILEGIEKLGLKKVIYVARKVGNDYPKKRKILEKLVGKFYKVDEKNFDIFRRKLLAEIL